MLLCKNRRLFTVPGDKFVRRFSGSRPVVLNTISLAAEDAGTHRTWRTTVGPIYSFRRTDFVHCPWIPVNRTACYSLVCGDFFPFPRLNSHSHGNPMGPMGSQSFPFPCTPLTHSSDWQIPHVAHHCPASQTESAVWVKKIPPTVFWNFFPKRLGIFNQFLHTYYVMISTLDTNFYSIVSNFDKVMPY